MSLRCVVSAVVAAVLLCVAPSAAAHPPTHHKGEDAVVTPVERIGGLTGAELLERSFAIAYEEELAPDFSGCLPFVPGTVDLILPPEGGEVACTVTAGTKILILPGVSCSDAEPEPFFGRDEAEQRACVRANLEGFPTVSVSVDGAPPVNITSEPFALATEQFAVDVVPGNPFEAEPGPATVVAEGWGAVFRLRPGRHTLVFTATGEDAPPPATVTVEVVDGCKPHRS
jgi:hypothetical protein